MTRVHQTGQLPGTSRSNRVPKCIFRLRYRTAARCRIEWTIFPQEKWQHCFLNRFFFYCCYFKKTKPCKVLLDAKDSAGSNLNDVVTLILTHLNALWLKHGAVASSSLARYTNSPLNALCYFQSLTVLNCTILPLGFQPFSMLAWIQL